MFIENTPFCRLNRDFEAHMGYCGTETGVPKERFRSGMKAYSARFRLRASCAGSLSRKKREY